uniref:Uncharacterized protein n=1 Tax=Arundo donax TaxID=35708 RepID=A0A0A8ZQL0_ARUDO
MTTQIQTKTTRSNSRDGGHGEEVLDAHGRGAGAGVPGRRPAPWMPQPGGALARRRGCGEEEGRDAVVEG